MNKNIKVLCKEISQGNNIEVNLPQFFNQLATLYNQYSDIKFTLQYYNFYESLSELDFGLVTDVEKQILSEINQIVKDSILSDFSGEEMEKNVKRLDDTRNHIMRQVKILTAYTDIIQNYEYVLNRIEYQFRDDMREIDDDDFATDILSYIFDTKDNVVIHGKIQEMLGQLPIRMTKAKYFELLRDSISIYKGNGYTALETYIYMIKNGAMIYNPDGMDTEYPELIALRKELETVDFSNLVETDYYGYTTKVKNAVDFINIAVDYYYGLQEIVNHLYAIILTAPYADTSNYTTDKILSKSIIIQINEKFLEGEYISLADEVDNQLSFTEGKQETLIEQLETTEYMLFEIKTNYYDKVESQMLSPIYNSLHSTEILLSASIFADLNQVENNEVIDDAYILKMQDELVSLLSEAFKKCSKHVYRAIVANTINKMPVFFQSTDEVVDYVNNSLEQCHDMAEKNACLDIFESFIEE